MSMAMPTGHVHGHGYGPWPWPCLRTMAMAMPRDPRPSPKLCRREREREREIGQPASLKKQSPVTWRHEPLALTSGRLAHSHGSSQNGKFQRKLWRKAYGWCMARQSKKLKVTYIQIKEIQWKSIKKQRTRKKIEEHNRKATESMKFKGNPRNR